MEKISLQAEDVALFLQQHPEFFEQHPRLFCDMRLPHPHEGRAISLAERQIVTLRERLHDMEERLLDMIHNAQDNQVISELFLKWARGLLLERDPMCLPDSLKTSMADIFNIPDVALRIWAPLVQPLQTAPHWYAPVTENLRSFVNSLQLPFCGRNLDLEAAHWLAIPPESVALIPLRIGMHPDAFGLLVLGSPDPERYTEDMGTLFLERVGDYASAALSRIIDY